MYNNKSIDDNVLLFSAEFLKHREYWKNKITQGIVNTEICFNEKYQPAPNKKRNLETITVTLSQETAVRVVALGKNVDLSIYIMLIAALKMMIHRYTGNQDVSIISPLNKSRVKEETINSFVFVRDTVQGNMTFKELVLAIRESLLQAYNHQDYPMEKFLEHLFGTPDEESDTFISNILCTLNTLHSDGNIDLLDGALTFLFQLEEGRLSCNLSYDTQAYDDWFVRQMAGHFSGILDCVIQNVNINVSRVSYLSTEEKQRLIFEFNDTVAEYPRHKTIHGLFADQVQKSPDNTAVVGADGDVWDTDTGDIDNEHAQAQSITYKELDKRSGLLAQLLIEKGCGTNSIVAVMTYPMVEMMVAIFAVIRTGACYLPIDPMNPKGRVNYLLTDSETQLLLTHSLLEDKCDFNGELINIDDESLYYRPTSETDPVSLPLVECEPHHPVYMIYTSGTTGNPKGVLVKHQNLVNYVSWFAATTSVTDSDRALLTSSAAFDLGYTCIFPSLLQGAQLHIIHRENYMLAENLLSYIRSEEITYLKMTPSLFSIVVADSDFSRETCGSLRLVVLGGEAINVKDVEEAYRRCDFLRIMNHYGPTEATIGCIARFVEADKLEAYKEKPTIGKPIANTQAFILDQYKNLLPLGISGELCIAGAGIAAGYFKQNKLAAEKFIQLNELAECDIYCTGDLASWVPEGNLQFLGRIDHQVKVRGFRIELGEIETKLTLHHIVKEAVAVVKEDRNGSKYISSYFVPSDPSRVKFPSAPNAAIEIENEAITDDLRNFLINELPEYMIPSYFIPIHAIPLTPNGKLDRKSLPEPGVSANRAYKAPRTEIERQLVVIWEDVLGVEPESISIDGNFFEMGGNSLYATMLAARIHKDMHVKLPLAEVFRAPKIIELASYIDKSGKEKFMTVPAVEDRDYYPMSSGQRRFYMLRQMEADSTAYNMPIVLVLEGKLDRERVTYAFDTIIKRHESLRTTFDLIDGEMVQIIHDTVDFKVEFFESDDENANTIVNDFERPFDLSIAPLLRVGLIKTAEHRHILMMDAHHIVSDGVSLRIMEKDFITIYSGQEPGQLKTRYRDYSAWQVSDEGKALLKRQENFWLKELSGELPVIDILTDFPRPEIQDFSGDIVDFKMTPELSEKIKQLSAKEGATIYIVLLAIFNVFLSKQSGQEDIIVGMTALGRNFAGFGDIVGLFTNALALRNHPVGEKSFSQFLAEVKENSLKAYDNQEYPFESLVEKVLQTRQSGRNPIFDILFEIKHDLSLPDVKKAQHQSDVKFEPYQYDREVSVFDMMWTAADYGDHLYFTVDYIPELFERTTIEMMIESYLELAGEILQDVEVKIKDLQSGSFVDKSSDMDMDLNFKF